MDPRERERKLDAWLDDALAHYNDAEPRTGLEQRVLATMRSEAQNPRRKWWMVWAPALTAAAVIALVFIALRPTSGPKLSPPAQVEKTPTSTAATNLSEAQPNLPREEAKQSKVTQPTRPTAVARSRAIRRRGTVLPNSPLVARLEPPSPSDKERTLTHREMNIVFAAPSPLTKQERLMVATLNRGISLEIPGPDIPAGDAPLPEVRIQEIQIKPLHIADK